MAGSLLPPVVAVLAANTTEFSAKMLAAKGELGAVVDSSSKLGTAGKIGLLGLAAAAGTAAVAAVHMGTEYQTQLTKLYTAAGAPKQAVLDNSNAILSLATSVGQTGTAMAEALYHPVSAGLDLQTSLQVVKYAAEEAQISGANLEDTTYSLSSVMKAFNQPASQAAGTMASLNAIVGEGDMRFQDFNESVKNWAPTAAQMGISINSMGAGLAYLTDRGNSAEVAATRLTMGISMMTTPSGQAAKMLEGLGVASSDVKASSSAMEDAMKKANITQNQLAGDLKKPDGLYVALKDLQDGLKKAGVSGTEADSVLAKIFGGGRSDKAIMSLLQNLDGLKDKFNAISKDSTAQKFQQNWDDARKTFGFQMQQIKAAAENALTHLGTALLPKLSSFISTMGAAGGKAIHEFMAGFSGNTTDTSGLAKLGAFIRPIVTDLETGGKQIAKAVGNMLAAVAPLAKIFAGALLMGVRAVADVFAHVLGPALDAVTGFLKKNQEIVTVLGGAYLGYKATMMAIQIATKAWAVAQGILNAVMDANPIMLIILAVAGLVLGVVELIKHWSQVSAFFKGLWADVVKIFDDAVQWIAEKIGLIVGFFEGLWTRVSGAITRFKDGIRQKWDEVVASVVAWLLTMEGKIHDWFAALPGKIGDFFKNAGQWLLNAGKAILDGFLNGLKKAWDAVTGFFSGIGNWISQHKGPLDYDRQLLVPHGNAVMDGFLEGLQSGGQRVGSYLDNFTTGIGDTSITGNIGVAGGLGGPSGTAGGVTIQVIVQGSLLSTKQDIKTAVQEAFLQNNMRNVQNGLTFATT